MQFKSSISTLAMEIGLSDTSSQVYLVHTNPKCSQELHGELDIWDYG